MMNELNDLNLDSMRAELAYRRSRLTGDAHDAYAVHSAHGARNARSARGADRSARRWWHRMALAPREHH